MKLLIDKLSPGEARAIEATAERTFPLVLPSGWRKTKSYTNAAWWKRYDDLAVCCEIEAHFGRAIGISQWIHISISRPDKDPSYRDLKAVKDIFAGPKRKAIMVLPAESEHYNFHPHCLHLFCPLEDDPIPDFRREDGSL